MRFPLVTSLYDVSEVGTMNSDYNRIKNADLVHGNDLAITLSPVDTKFF